MLNTFSFAFLAALLLMCALRLWLAQRQISHVIARIETAVPESFCWTYRSRAHQKAADYTVARTRFGRVGLAIEVAVLLGLHLRRRPAGTA
jgi:STE24 endopeptidase